MTKLILAPRVAASLRRDVVGIHAAIRDAARKVVGAEGAFVGRELMHLENLLAQGIWAAHGDKPNDTRIGEIAQDIWPMIQSPIGLRNWFLANRICVAPEDYFALIGELVAERGRADAMHSGEASEMLRSRVERLSAKFPALKLSFGYIGNCDLGCGRRYDDRSWKVFTKIATSFNTCSDVSWGGYPTEALGRMAIAAERDLEAWCAEKSRELSEGKLRRLTAIAA